MVLLGIEMSKAYRKTPQSKFPKVYTDFYDEIEVIAAKRKRWATGKISFSPQEAKKLDKAHSGIFEKICKVFELTSSQRSELLGIKQQIETSHSTYDYHLEKLELP